MSEAELVQTISQTGPSGVVTAVAVTLTMLAPVLWKLWNNAKQDSASGALYQHLSEQVAAQSKEIAEQRASLDAVYRERNVMAEELYRLRARIDGLEQAETTVTVLKRKLDEKDQIISERDAKISSLMDEMLRMKDRIHSLEVRLSADEKKFCQSCQKAQATV